MNTYTGYSKEYWENCWQQEDTLQLAKYLANFNQRQNSIVELFKANNISHVCDVACGFGAYSLLFASMIFHPYTENEIKALLSGRNIERLIIREEAESTVILKK